MTLNVNFCTVSAVRYKLGRLLHYCIYTYSGEVIYNVWQVIFGTFGAPQTLKQLSCSGHPATSCLSLLVPRLATMDGSFLLVS